MLFSSQIFVLGFLPPVLAAYYLAPSMRTRQWLLVIASLAFYGYWDIRFVPALVGLTLVIWAISKWFEATGQRWIPILGIIISLVVLGVFKYANFFASNVAALLGQGFTPLNIILPLGISFFTFQKISYLADLYRGDRHFYGLLEFFAFVTFFPQLIAGPIVRHNEMMPQWRNDPHNPELWENLSRGAVLFVIGFVKKTGFADSIALIGDPLYARAITEHLNMGQAWTAALSFASQVYFDFSGYSDMAIGLGLMFGLRLPMNFDAPFKATSLQDLWRRWHMTLSRFLRDYVYISLGGNRGSRLFQVRNVILTMLLGGLWHGAAWTTVLWGGLQGVGLAANSFWSRRRIPMPRALAWVITVGFFVVSLVVFRAATLGVGWRMLVAMSGADGLAWSHIDNVWILALGWLVATIGPTSQQVALDRLRPTGWAALSTGAVLVGMLLLAGGRVPAEFIYFQF